MDSESSSDEEDEAVNEDTMPILHVSSFSKCTAVNLAMNFTCFASQFAHLIHYSNMLCICLCTAKKGGSCGVCKSYSLYESGTTYMCNMGRHRSCSGILLCLAILLFFLLLLLIEEVYFWSLSSLRGLISP
jgi:hypothetical protein